MTDNEMLCVEMATLYKLRLKISAFDKKEYTAEEILELIDKVAKNKEQKKIF